MKNIVFLSVLLILGISACIQPPDYPIEPQIEFISVSKSELQQLTDTLWITFSYTDGDGDIGIELDTLYDNNIIVADSRTGFEETFRVPVIPQQGASNGISGEITVLLLSSCCLNSSPTCSPTPGVNPEEIIYSIHMFDKAGNSSDTIQTTPVFLICD